jgi:hypothetical protein
MQGVRRWMQNEIAFLPLDFIVKCKAILISPSELGCVRKITGSNRNPDTRYHGRYYVLVLVPQGEYRNRVSK